MSFYPKEINELPLPTKWKSIKLMPGEALRVEGFVPEREEFTALYDILWYVIDHQATQIVQELSEADAPSLVNEFEV